MWRRMYSTCYASCVQYMLHFLCTVHGSRTDTDLDKRVGSEQEGKEANSKHRGVLRSDLRRFRTVETRQSVHEPVMVHRNTQQDKHRQQDSYTSKATKY